MRTPSWLQMRPEVADALHEGQPVVALESTLIAQGLPWPHNLETAVAAENAVRAAGAAPATMAVIDGRPRAGLEETELHKLARSAADNLKACRRDLGLVMAQGRTAATTVSATIFLAYGAGIRVCATGGIGGAHRGDSWDISADLMELSRLPVAVVCAGAKSVLDISRTLEILETLSVPVIGYRTDTFPAFYLRSSGEPVSGRVNSPEGAAGVLAAHWDMGGQGVVLAQPVSAEATLEPAELQTWLAEAEGAAAKMAVRGKDLTPFLLARLHELSQGKTRRANQALVVANARLAAEVAVQFVAKGTARA